MGAKHDLVIVNDSLTPAVGEVTHLSGRIVDLRGDPVRNATIEVWQVDGKGRYIHSADGGRAGKDAHFQGSAASSPARPASTTSAR